MYLYTPGRVPEGTELGFVEVHASGSEATLDLLTPLFVRKAASLGANAAVIEHVNAAFSIVTRPQVETYAYPCGYWTCTGTRMYALAEEVMTVTLRGRAILVEAAPEVGTEAPRELAPAGAGDERFP